MCCRVDDRELGEMLAADGGVAGSVVGQLTLVFREADDYRLIFSTASSVWMASFR